jgi:ABC-type multidrug transport system fused ATPase/permease subunit
MSTGMKALYWRTLEIRKAIAGFSIASLIDVIVIWSLSVIFERIAAVNGNDLVILAFGGFILVFLRTGAIFFLRQYSYRELMEKKNRDEHELVKIFVQRRSLTLPEKENSIIGHFKESITNATQLATINFDLPMVSLIGEVLFSIAGFMILIHTLGLPLILVMMPVVFISLIVMRSIANNLRSLGSDIMHITEDRLVRIDNIAETSLELCVASAGKTAADYFDSPNRNLNGLIRRQLTLSNSIQLTVESASFIIILLCLVLITFNLVTLTLGAAAASFAVLTRMVPTITRSISSITQLNYGIPAVIKLHNYKCNKLAAYVD